MADGLQQARTSPRVSIPESTPCLNKDTFTDKSLRDVLYDIETQNDPLKFKENVLSLFQMYFDSIVEHEGGGSELWDHQSAAMDALFTVTKETVLAYFDPEISMPYDHVRETILSYDTIFFQYAEDAKHKSRYLEDADILQPVDDVAHHLADHSIDVVVPILSGGLEPAILMSDALGVEDVLPIRYSRRSRGDAGVIFPSAAPATYASQAILDKNVLFVDDMLASGNTMAMVSEWSKKFSPQSTFFGLIIGHVGIHVADLVPLPGTNLVYTYG